MVALAFLLWLGGSELAENTSFGVGFLIVVAGVTIFMLIATPLDNKRRDR